jgi:DMSO/TMAO reductase YedYZ heme-binding membrane subunit
MILWEIARATGLVAVLVYTLTAAWGTLLAGRGVQSPKGAVELHQVLQSFGLLLIISHVVALVLDQYANVPFLSVVGIDSRPSIVLGAVALWLSILLPLSFALRKRKKVSFRFWRGLHYFAYVFWAAAMIHGLWLGSDTGNPVILALYGLGIALVVGAAAWRFTGGAPPMSAKRTASDV